jgi:hypothetical protein
MRFKKISPSLLTKIIAILQSSMQSGCATCLTQSIGKSGLFLQ